MQVCTTTGPQRVESSAVTKRPKKKLAVPRRIMSLLESNFTIRILTKAVPPRHTCTRSILYIPPPRLTSHKWSLPLRFSALSSKSISSIPRHVLSSQPPWFHHRNNKKRTNYKAPDIWGFRGGQYDVRPSFGAVKTRLHLLQTLVPAQACTPRPRTTLRSSLSSFLGRYHSLRGPNILLPLLKHPQPTFFPLGCETEPHTHTKQQVTKVNRCFGIVTLIYCQWKNASTVASDQRDLGFLQTFLTACACLSIPFYIIFILLFIRFATTNHKLEKNKRKIITYSRDAQLSKKQEMREPSEKIKKARRDNTNHGELLIIELWPDSRNN